MNVAYAIVKGLLDQEKIPVELLDEMKLILDSFQTAKDRGELKEPNEE